MTKLNKPVKRKIDGLLRDPITVILYPSGVIGFREHRAHKVYTLPLMTCYKFAIEAERQQKIREKKARKHETR